MASYLTLTVYVDGVARGKIRATCFESYLYLVATNPIFLSSMMAVSKMHNTDVWFIFLIFPLSIMSYKYAHFQGAHSTLLAEGEDLLVYF